jgi:hypothetical protein
MSLRRLIRSGALGAIQAKLEARDRAHLVVIAYETGLVTASAAKSSRTSNR